MFLLKFQEVFLRVYMKSIVFLFFITFIYSGCVGKWVGSELDEADLTNIAIAKKVSFRLKKDLYVTKAPLDELWGALVKGKLSLSGGFISFSDDEVFISDFDKALKNSLVSSNYIKLGDDVEDSYTLEVSLASPKIHNYWTGILISGFSYLILPAPSHAKSYEATFKVYSTSDALLKSYRYTERVEAATSLLFPLVFFMDSNNRDVVETLMDKFVSNFIHDLENDKAISFYDIKKI